MTDRAPALLPPNKLGTRHRLIVFITLSALIVGLLSWLHYEQRRNAAANSQQLREFRLARTNLAEGFLALSLSAEPDSPYSRNGGLALLRQSIDTFNDAASVVGSSPLDAAAFSQSVARFERLLDSWQKTNRANPSDLIALRLAFSDLTLQCSRFDSTIQTNLRDKRATQERVYQLTLLGAFLALAGLLAIQIAMERRETQAQLEQSRLRDAQQTSEARFQHLFSQAPIGLAVVDRDGTLKMENRAFISIFGYTADELDQMDEWRRQVLINEDQRHEQEAEWTRMWQQGSGASGHFELTTRHKDGSIRTVLLHRLIVGNEMLLVVMDITDRKRIEDELAHYRDHLESLVRLRTDELQTQERFLRHLLQALPGMVAYWDKDFQCRFSNAAYVEWFGAHPDEMTGMTIRQLLGDPLYAENEPYILGALRGEPQHFERSKVKPNGEVGHMLAHYIPDIVNGEVVGFLAVVDDVTRVKESELAAARALAKAEEASRAKGEFLANMSHEIRTPLNGVLGLAQIGYRDSFNLKKVQETFSRILDSGRLLQTIINDILDFSKIEAGKLAIESRPFSPADLVDETVAGVLALAAPKSISVYSEKIDLPAAALGDSLRLSQILYNLLSNAIKFTERGEVKLVAQCQGGELILSVSDTGIGIDSSALNRLFKPFEQADTSTTRQFGGTGLGLTISRRLAVLMDGSLTVESKPSEGSTFTLRVPFKPTNEPVAERKVHGVVGAKRLTGLHILVAEDNQVNQMVIEEMLEGEGAHVVMAQNGQQAVELAQLTSAPFDVVLMDVQMPLMDGLVATRKIKEVHPELPVIGQTAHALKEEMDKCQAAGMAATVNKPIELDDLVAMIIKTIHADSKRRNQPGRPTHIKPPSVPEAPLIDVAALKQRYARKPEFAERLIVAFLRHHLNESSKLRSCALAQDYDGIEEIAHRLKGSTGNIGASAVMRHAHETQELAYAKQAQALDHARQLADMLDKVILVLQSEG